MYSNLIIYKNVQTKYEPSVWINMSKCERGLTYACFTMFRLLSGCCCLRNYKCHTQASKICQLCCSNEAETVFHFVLVCDHFHKLRFDMFKEIENSITDESKNHLESIADQNIHLFILLGMDYNICSNDLYMIRKISLRFIHKMYQKRLKIEKDMVN